MAYSITSITDDCYPGTTCLINILDIRDEAMLANAEASIALAKASFLDQHPINGGYDFEHYKQIHHYLFCDLYDWAGEIRKVNTSKKGTAFVPAAEIAACATACFERLSGFSAIGLSKHELAAEVADFYSTVNMLHPFREGNGRTQRIFFKQWLQHLGYTLDLTNVDADEFMIATIQAAHGVMDMLIDFFEKSIL